MKATMNIEVVVSTDSDQKDILWREDDATLNTIVRDDLTVHNSGVATVVAAATFPVPFGDVTTGRVLKISTDAEIAVYIDGSVTPIAVVGTTSYRGLLALHGSFTSISVIAGAAAANVRYCVAGV